MTGAAASLVVGVAQPVVRTGDLAAAVATHADAVRAAGARVVAFPELSLTGYELDAAAVAPDDEILAPLVAACTECGTVALAGAPVVVDGRRRIAVLRIDGDGARVVYAKTFLGGAEAGSFAPGDGARTVEVDGWRIGLGVCRDTGVAEHVAAVAALGVDLYLAGVVHHADELAEQDRRGAAIAAACGAPVGLASFAGPTGGGYRRTAGRSTLWSVQGAVLARADHRPGRVAIARLDRRRWEGPALRR